MTHSTDLNDTLFERAKRVIPILAYNRTVAV